MYFSAPFLLLTTLTFTHAHFLLNIPTSLGFDDDKEIVAPCGGFNASDRRNVTSWPVQGSSIGLLSTHASGTFEFRAALLSNLSNWEAITPSLNETGAGNVCEPVVPVKAAWAGKQGVVQVVMRRPEYVLYQVRDFTSLLIAQLDGKVADMKIVRSCQFHDRWPGGDGFGVLE
jgi:hypothetical protein